MCKLVKTIKIQLTAKNGKRQKRKQESDERTVKKQSCAQNKQKKQNFRPNERRELRMFEIFWKDKFGKISSMRHKKSIFCSQPSKQKKIRKK